MSRRRLIQISVAVVIAAGVAIAWWFLSRPALPPGFAGGNGRIEAKEIDIATKYPGRIKQVLFDEGNMVNAGQVAVVIDTEPLEAQLRASQAKIREAEDNRRTAAAEVQAQQAEFGFASQQYARSTKLLKSGAVSGQEHDLDRAKLDSTRAALSGAKAQEVRSQSAIDAATAESERLKAEISDNTIRAPVRVRVQSRVAEPGEVLGAGGKVLLTYDLSDVYMYIFLPTDVAGKVTLGSEARIVLDALPDYPIRAYVSYVASTAQFTPKTVETAEERHNLSFRVKLQLDKNRLAQYERLVKAGLPGMGYVRTDPNAPWPEKLQYKGVPEMPWQPTGTVGSR
jgi:HlyD family secretion protein